MKNGKKYHTVGTFKNLIREGTYFNEFIASYWRKAYVSSWVTSNLYVVGKGGGGSKMNKGKNTTLSEQFQNLI